MPSIRQRRQRQRRSKQVQRFLGGRRSRRGSPAEEPSAAITDTGAVIPVEQVETTDNVVEVVPVSELSQPEVEEYHESSMNGGRSRRLRRGGRRASKIAQRGGRAVSLKTAVRLLRNYYAKRYA